MTDYNPGDEWEEHYRGYELRINSDGQMWWQVYNGTERLEVEPTPTELVDQFLELKPLGGRVRVTDGGSVITRREDEDVDGSRSGRSLEDYTAVYVGDLDLAGHLVPTDTPKHKVPIKPTDLSSGDLWPSVYDGARYSFGMNGSVWWQNTETKKRHPLCGELNTDVRAALTRLKPEGGSFRVTPWGDVITLVRSPATQTVRDQFGELPRIVQNIIKLRRDRGDLQMLPLYVGRISDVPLRVDEPPSLTDQLSKEEQNALKGWAASLGSTSATSTGTHRANAETSSNSNSGTGTTDEDSTGGTTDETTSTDNGGEELPDDDPVAWLEEDMKKTEDRIHDR